MSGINWARLEKILAPEKQASHFAYPASQGADLAAQAFAQRNAKFVPLNEQAIHDWAQGNTARKLGVALTGAGIAGATLDTGQGDAMAGGISWRRKNSSM